MLAVIGCPRSGTKYIATILNEMGAKIGHERPGDDGMVDWELVSLSTLKDFADVVLHQVREPLATIGSMLTLTENNWNKIQGHMGTQTPDLVHRALRTWVCWNKMAEKKADWIYRVEEFDYNKFRMFIRESGCLDCVKRLPDVPKDTNSREHPVVTWPELYRADYALASMAAKMAVGYGYKNLCGV